MFLWESALLFDYGLIFEMLTMLFTVLSYLPTSVVCINYIVSQQTFTCYRPTVKTLDKGVKYVQS